jgi:hypothetical protein
MALYNMGKQQSGPFARATPGGSDAQKVQGPWLKAHPTCSQFNFDCEWFKLTKDHTN